MWTSHPAPYGDESDSELESASVEIEVDGELFGLRSDGRSGTHYTWLSGPNAGYGFTVSPTSDASMDEHLMHIRAFLDQIDPATGFIGDE
jgi:hypothetical protein